MLVSIREIGDLQDQEAGDEYYHVVDSIIELDMDTGLEEDAYLDDLRRMTQADVRESFRLAIALWEGR